MIYLRLIYYLDRLHEGSIYAIKKYNVGKSYVVFGKKDTYSIELSDISSGIGGIRQ
jgi:hypothetical protein